MENMTLTYLDTLKGVLLLKKGKQYIFPKFNLMSSDKGLDNLHGREEACIRNTKNQTGITLIEPIFRGVVNIGGDDISFNRDISYLIFSATKYSGTLDRSDVWIPTFVNESDLPGVLTSIYGKQIYGWLQDERNFMGNIKIKGAGIDSKNSFANFF